MGEIVDTGELIQGTLEMLILKALVRAPPRPHLPEQRLVASTCPSA